jgi:hypothetical protein
MRVMHTLKYKKKINKCDKKNSTNDEAQKKVAYE